MRSLVAAGFGVSPVAARAAEHHVRPGVVFVPFRDAPAMEYGILEPAAKRAPCARLFVEFISELVGVTEAES
ncbi:hypothetical protein [Streptomyces gilvus]|uniref:hypothetical protein n=1 Tax=Streptomyces gilvus TaxID=2920937 RepID=UPI001F0FE869|nr:hypothetical protein [Streptomyces sp. CME 23]MCH5675078.1 hypothetical protein [Streptomyces sp. CME 23]